jgi:gliding motility-associated-like protein
VISSFFMRIVILSFLSFSFLAQVFAQSETANWYFGEEAGIRFTDEGIVPLFDGQINYNEGISSISDCAGRLLFYTDGEQVWSRSHQLMPNGTDIGGHYSSTQGALIIPHPADCNRYFIFTLDGKENGYQNGLRWSEVDLQADVGFGAVVQKDQPLYPGASEKMTAVLHADGRSVWVITHAMNSNAFHVFLVDENGVNPTPVISQSGIPFVTASQGLGQMKATPDGKRLAFACLNLKMVQIFDFDTASGKVSNPITIEGDTFDRPGLYGLEFSPSGRFLYVSNHTLDYLNESGYLYQFDLDAGIEADIVATATIVGQNAPPSDMRGLQMGADGRIYVTRSLSSYLGVVNNPEASGLACDYEDEGVSLGGRIGLWSLPNFMVSYFDATREKPEQPTFEITKACPGEPSYFRMRDLEPEAFREWQFGDGLISTRARPFHIYPKAGDYQVGLVYERECCRDTVTTWITLDSCILEEPLQIYIPNAFSPNADGANDRLHVYGPQIQSIDWQIFDRWGNLVFATQNLLEGWDGRHRGKRVPPGIYTYLIKVSFPGREVEILEGSVAIIP